MDRVPSTIIRREQRAVTAVMEDEEPERLARGSESAIPQERPTCAIDPDALRELVDQTDLEPKTGEIEARIPHKLETEPRPPVIVDLPNERPTQAIHPDELKLLTRPPVLPTYHGRPARWPWLVLIALAGVLAYLLYP